MVVIAEILVSYCVCFCFVVEVLKQHSTSINYVVQNEILSTDRNK